MDGIVSNHDCKFDCTTLFKFQIRNGKPYCELTLVIKLDISCRWYGLAGRYQSYTMARVWGQIRNLLWKKTIWVSTKFNVSHLTDRNEFNPVDWVRFNIKRCNDLVFAPSDWSSKMHSQYFIPIMCIHFGYHIYHTSKQAW